MNDRVGLFGMHIDRLTMPEAVAQLMKWVSEPEFECRYVVTPNVNHVVMFQKHAGLRAAYAEAGLVLADGFPVVLASRWCGRALPARVTGSDIVPALFSAGAARGLRVFLLGAAPGVAERAAANIELKWPGVRVVGTYSPPLGFEKQESQNRLILEKIAAASPDLLVIGFGAPKQELWVHAHAHQVRARVAVCAGATIDFLAGEKSRAPRWLQNTGLEWLHRVSTEPRRLFRRYAGDGLIFPRLVWRELWACRAARKNVKLLVDPRDIPGTVTNKTMARGGR